MERYLEVREWADSVDKSIPVILKRYCTEYEIGPGALGPSNELPEQSGDELVEEQKIDALIYQRGPQYGSKQPDHLVAHVMRAWIHWAYQFGDESYKEFTNGSPLFPPYVTYHGEIENDDNDSPGD